ncbi:hypothetical protein AB0I39_27225 [Kitasatospora purpeofusca]
MPSTPLTRAEQHLITAVTTPCPEDLPAAGVVLAQGRLFTPRP